MSPTVASTLTPAPANQDHPSDTIATHAFTLFNGINIVLACLVAYTGAWRNLTFLCVVLSNLAIGVVQELRSKRAIDKLSILAERPVTVSSRWRGCRSWACRGRSRRSACFATR